MRRRIWHHRYSLNCACWLWISNLMQIMLQAMKRINDNRIKQERIVRLALEEQGARMKFLRLILMVAFIGFSTCSNAVTTWGSISCGEWIKARAFHTANYAEYWVGGYLSGVAGGTGIDLLASTNEHQLYSWIDNYCQFNRFDDTAHASAKLAEALIRNK